MSVCYDDFSVFFHVTHEVVFPPGASLFNDLEIAALMEFFIIKVGAIQCFQDAAYFTAKLICSWHRLQACFVALFAYDVVPIPVGGLEGWFDNVNVPTVSVRFSLIS